MREGRGRGERARGEGKGRGRGERARGKKKEGKEGGMGREGKREGVGWGYRKEVEMNIFSPIGRGRGLKVTQLFPEEGEGDTCFITTITL